jgi:P27 family predicted phage terminase small subunit
MRTPEPPKTLARKGAALWRRTLAEREFSAAELALLEAFCAAADTWAQAQVVVKSKGVTTVDRFGALRPNPAVVIARDAAATMSRLAKQLGVELEDDDSARVRHPHAARTGPRRR